MSYKLALCTLLLASSIHAQSVLHTDGSDISRRDNTLTVPRPALGSVPYGSIITTCTTPNTVALTYDDGPGPYTAELLDTLAANNISATFFILGNRNGSGPIDQVYPDLIKRIYREGHQIASHTWDHQSLESLSSTARIAEMTQNEVVFKEILGFWPTYMRPPYGFCYGPSGCLSDMGTLGYHVIDWNVDTKDYENDSPTLIQNAKNNWDAAFLSAPLSSSFIPLTHDIHQNTVENLAPYMIKEIQQRGFQFKTVGQCLNDPPQNWYRNGTSGGSIINKGLAVTSSTSLSATSTSSVHSSASSNASAKTTSSSSSALSSVNSQSTTASASVAKSTNSGISLTINVMMYGMLAALFMLVNA